MSIKFVYFVAYETVQGPANREVFLDSPISSIEDIKKVEMLISTTKEGALPVAVANFIELRIDEEVYYDD